VTVKSVTREAVLSPAIIRHLKILKPKVTKNITNSRKKFCEWGIQARESMVTKLTKVSGKQMDFLLHRKKFLIFF